MAASEAIRFWVTAGSDSMQQPFILTVALLVGLLGDAIA
jgi:hypothetical protein